MGSKIAGFGEGIVDKSVKLFENPEDASHLALKWMEMNLSYKNSLQGH